MNKLLIAIAFASLLSACAEAPRRTSLAAPVVPVAAAVVEEDSVALENEAAFSGPGAATAASLGFHGPVERVVARSTN